MTHFGIERLVGGLLVVALSSSLQAARADEVLASSFPGGVVTGMVNAELIVDVHTTVASGAFVNGNVKQPNAGANWNITIQPDATINGDIQDSGGGSVFITVGPGQFVDDNVTESGAGSVSIRISDGGLYNGNVVENGAGHVVIVVLDSGLYNGNAYENNGGHLVTLGTGMFNGSTKEQGGGSCSNAIEDFNGSPCE